MNWRYVPLWRLLLIWIVGLALLLAAFGVIIYFITELA